MLFFKKRKRAEKEAKVEAAITEIKKDTFNKIDNATKETRKLNQYLRKKGVTEMIFEASGGNRR